MQNYIIFNKNNKILITNSELETKNSAYANLINCNSENLDKQSFAPLFNDKDTKDTIIFAQNIDTKDIFAKMATQIKYIKAAGGIIYNEDNQILFIYRNGFWDLAKGHWEEGEQLNQTAKREVQEECGVKNPIVYQYLASSFHSYDWYGHRELKETFWFKMFVSKKETFTPQVEEGLTKVCWIDRQQLPEILPLAHKNIQQLFKTLNIQ